MCALFKGNGYIKKYVDIIINICLDEKYKTKQKKGDGYGSKKGNDK